MTSTLDYASDEILQSLELVGDLAASISSVSSGVVGEFGILVKRMTTGQGNKPTPFENYVGMVTKRDARKSTALEEEEVEA